MTTRMLERIEDNKRSTNFYVIPTTWLSPHERRDWEQAVIAFGKNMAHKAYNLPIAEMTARPGLANADFGLNAADQEDWRLPLLTLGTVAAWINNLAVPNNTIWVFYGFGSEEANPAVTELRFSVGTGQVGRIGGFHLEKAYPTLETSGFFSTPMLYAFGRGGRGTLTVQVVPRLTVAAGNRLQLYTYVIEAKGEYVV